MPTIPIGTRLALEAIADALADEAAAALDLYRRKTAEHAAAELALAAFDYEAPAPVSVQAVA